MPHQTMCIDNNFEELADGSKVQVLLLWQDFNYLAERGAQQDTNSIKSFWNPLMTTVFNTRNEKINRSKNQFQAKA